MIPVLIIPVLNRFDLLQRTLDSIDYPVKDLLIIDNSNSLNIDPEDWESENGIKTMTVLHMPNNFGVAGSWNLGIKCFPHALYWVIGSNDTAWVSGSLALLADMSDQRLFVKTNANWGTFSIGRDVVGRVGLFDENYYPAYYEDDDYGERMKRNDITPVVANIPMQTFSVTTTAKSNPHFDKRNKKTNSENCRYFNEKFQREDWVVRQWDVDRRVRHEWLDV